MNNAPAEQSWLAALLRAAEEASFVKASITMEKSNEIRSADIRPILVKRQPKLSVTFHYRTRDIVKNYDVGEIAGQLTPLLATCAHAKLYTTAANHQFKRHGKPAELTTAPPTITAAPDMQHDREKKRYLTTHNKPYLYALGITDAKGNLLKTAQDKFRQINKYLEILDGLMAELPQNGPLRIVDMGSGKGYLTFALYDYIAHTLKREVTVTGVEYRQDMVTLCNDIAQAAEFRGLNFTQNTIAGYQLENPTIVIALHACDTATDDAIFSAICAQAPMIVVAPCCHKQLRRDMATPADHALNPLLKHGTYTERFAEMATDAIRAELMETEGYRTKLFEFIGSEHTPKNVMIIGVKSTASDALRRRAEHAQALTRLKTEIGITRHYLEERLAKKA